VGCCFFVRTKAIALLLGPAGVGIISVIDQFVQLALQLSSFAIPFVAVKYLSKAHSEGETEFQETYASLLSLLLRLGTCGAAISAVLILVFPSLIGQQLEAHIGLVLLGLAGIPAAVLHGYFRNVPAAALKPKTAAVCDVLVAGLMTTGILLGVLSFEIQGYFVGALAGAFTISIAYYLYLRSSMGLRLKNRYISFRQLLHKHPSMFEFSLISYVLAFTLPLTWLIVRATVFGSLGAESAGILQAAIGISLAVNMLLNPVNGLLLTPHMNRVSSDDTKYGQAERFQRKLLLAIALVALPPCVFPDIAVLVLYSDQFLEAANYVCWFVLAQVLMQITGIYTALMIGLNRLRAYGLIVVLGTFSNALIAVMLIPILGLEGAGIAAFASASILSVGTLLYLHIRSAFRLSKSILAITVGLVLGMLLIGITIGTQSSFELSTFLIKVFSVVLTIAIVAWSTIEKPKIVAIDS